VVVLQGEVARLDIRAEADHELLVGSEDATTCVVAVAECAVAGVLATAHFDEGTCTPGCAAQLLAGMVAPVLFLCGAYADGKGTGARVAAELLTSLHHMDVRIDVRLACLGRRNTCPSGKPLARDLLYDQRGGVAAPLRVCVPVEGEAGEPLPGYTLRHARMWLSAGDGEDFGPRLHEVYSSDSGRAVTVPRFEYQLDKRRSEFFYLCLGIPDDVMLEHTSTSPTDERPEFSRVLRATFRWILSHPTDASCFTGGAAIQYAWDAKESGWLRQAGAPRLVCGLAEAKAEAAVAAVAASPAPPRQLQPQH